MRQWPTVVQFAALLLVADFTQYWVHRAFHAVPALWRFHAVHHSADQMDWLAGSRLHLVDIAVTRGLTYVPIYVLGFAEAPLFAYLVVVSVQATFIHANVNFAFGPLKWLVATPQFHHWHHAAEAEADRQELRGPPAGDRCRVRDLASARSLAAGVRNRARRTCADGYLRQFAWPFRQGAPRS